MTEGAPRAQRVALRLAALGARVAVVDIDAASAAAVAAEIAGEGGSASGYELDVSDFEAVEGAFGRISNAASNRSTAPA